MKHERIISSIIIAIAIIISSYILVIEFKPVIRNGFNSFNQSSQASNHQHEEVQHDGLMNLPEVASYIGLGSDRVKLLISHYDDFPYNKFGDKYVFSKKSVDEWFESYNINSDY